MAKRGKGRFSDLHKFNFETLNNWDKEMIGEIKDVIAEWMIERLEITDEQNFYPYLEH
ncbi:MAG: hypothetical protein AB1480_09985 [Nitrospirota bacterium]